MWTVLKSFYVISVLKSVEMAEMFIIFLLHILKIVYVRKISIPLFLTPSPGLPNRFTDGYFFNQSLAHT